MLITNNKKLDYIVLLDPGLSAGSTVKNLGDCIISEAVNNKLNELFPDEEIIRISSHKPVDSESRKVIKKAKYVFIGGTNLLSNYMHRMNYPLKQKRGFILSTNLKNVILFGVGWGYGYGVPKIDRNTMAFYKKIFERNKIQGVRDSYSEDKLLTNGFKNSVNTNCPTMWGINGLSMDLTLRSLPKKALFTLTDYAKDYNNDNVLIDLLAGKFKELFFFPQGHRDKMYIELLESYLKHKDKIKFIDRSLEAYDKFIKNEDFVYIGTRLHGGIRCLQNNKPALVLSIDNRAECIAKDTNLAACSRSDMETVGLWLTGKTNFGNIKLNLDGINSFIAQFG